MILKTIQELLRNRSQITSTVEGEGGLSKVDKGFSVLFLLLPIVVDTWAALSGGYFWLLVVLLLIVTVVDSNLLKVLLWTTSCSKYCCGQQGRG